MPGRPPGPSDAFVNSEDGSPIWPVWGNFTSGATTTVSSAASFGISFGTMTVGGTIWVSSDALGGFPRDAGSGLKLPPPPPLEPEKIRGKSRGIGKRLVTLGGQPIAMVVK